MIEEFTIKDMSDLLYEDLSKIKDNNSNQTEAVLQTPTVGNIFPCRVINTPLDSVVKSQNTIPILKEFQMTIEHWADSQENCMEMGNNTDKVLQKRNIFRTNTQPIIYDEITKKYKLIVIYGVRWEKLTNSFIYIK